MSNGKQFLSLAQRNFSTGMATDLFYTKDHLNSVREITKTVAGPVTTIEAQYIYSPFGRSTKLLGTQNSDFQYAGYYFHPSSGLNLPVYRAYSADSARFINRDPIQENGGLNLYAYVGCSPILATDPTGQILRGGIGMNVGRLATDGAYRGRNKTRFGEADMLDSPEPKPGKNDEPDNGSKKGGCGGGGGPGGGGNDDGDKITPPPEGGDDYDDAYKCIQRAMDRYQRRHMREILRAARNDDFTLKYRLQLNEARLSLDILLCILGVTPPGDVLPPEF